MRACGCIGVRCAAGCYVDKMMTRYITLILILFTVIITVKQKHSATCPRPDYVMIKGLNGVYERSETDVITVGYCITETVEQELWTDYPEKAVCLYGRHMLLKQTVT